MGEKIIMEGNSVYEIDEACMAEKRKQEKNREKEKKNPTDSPAKR